MVTTPSTYAEIDSVLGYTSVCGLAGGARPPDYARA